MIKSTQNLQLNITGSVSLTADIEEMQRDEELRSLARSKRYLGLNKRYKVTIVTTHSYVFSLEK